MKTGFAILMTALLFLTTPMLVSAHDGERHHDGKGKHSAGWVKERHEHREYRNERLRDRIERLEHRLDRQRLAKRHFKREAKQLRRELRHERRHERQERRYLARHYYPERLYSSALIYGLPSLVFHIDW